MREEKSASMKHVDDDFSFTVINIIDDSIFLLFSLNKKHAMATNLRLCSRGETCWEIFQ